MLLLLLLLLTSHDKELGPANGCWWFGGWTSVFSQRASSKGAEGEKKRKSRLLQGCFRWNLFSLLITFNPVCEIE